MKVLAICEDHTKDQYIIKPVLEYLLVDSGSVRGEVPSNPRVRGFADALAKTPDIVQDRRGMFDLFVLVVDRVATTAGSKRSTVC